MPRPRFGGAAAVSVLGAAGLLLTSLAAGQGRPAQEHQHGAAWRPPAAAEERRNPVPGTTDSVGAGQQLYAQNCLVCHGTRGKGDGPGMPPLPHAPPDLAAAPVQRQTDGALFWKITTGNPPMPPWASLSEQDRWNLVNYLRALARRPAG
jgi:mono/diheme cytochrome c family protein